MGVESVDGSRSSSSSSSIEAAEALRARLEELHRQQEEARRARAEKERQQAEAAKRAEEAQRIREATSGSKFEKKVDAAVVKTLELKPEAQNMSVDELESYRNAVSSVAKAKQIPPSEAVAIVENLADPENRATVIQAMHESTLGTSPTPEALQAYSDAVESVTTDPSRTSADAVSLLDYELTSEAAGLTESVTAQPAPKWLDPTMLRKDDPNAIPEDAPPEVTEALTSLAEMNQNGTVTGAHLTAAELQKIMPKLNPSEAKDATLVIGRALDAAGIKSPTEAAAFVAMTAEGTHELKGSDAYRFVTDAAKTWKSKNLGDLAAAGELNQVARKLGIVVSKAELKAGDKDALIAKAIELQLAGTPAAGKNCGKMMVDAGKKYGVDPFALLAIAGHETGFGKLGVGVEKMLGVSAYDSNPNGDYGMNGVASQIFVGAKTFANLRAKGGADANDDMATQLAAVNRGGWATDQNWHSGVLGWYQKVGGTKDVALQAGEAYYQTALQAFGVNKSGASSSAPGSSVASSSGMPSSYAAPGGGGPANSSGGSGGPVSSGGNRPPGAGPQQHAPSHARTISNRYANQYGFSMDAFWANLERIKNIRSLAWSLNTDPEFAKFVKKHGLDSWKLGQGLTDKGDQKKLDELILMYLAQKLGKEAKDQEGPKPLQAAANEIIKGLKGPMKMKNGGLGLSPKSFRV
jgi:hypothetical protein